MMMISLFFGYERCRRAMSSVLRTSEQEVVDKISCRK